MYVLKLHAGSVSLEACLFMLHSVKCSLHYPNPMMDLQVHIPDRTPLMKIMSLQLWVPLQHATHLDNTSGSRFQLAGCACVICARLCGVKRDMERRALSRGETARGWGDAEWGVQRPLCFHLQILQTIFFNRMFQDDT